jgi:Rrf2 family iron-sulfur cluster assembly transcriptional regulator
MHLSAQEEYGLRCMLQVARSGGKEPLSIPEVAEAEGLSAEYAAKLLRTLRQGGLLTSSRGAGGGYRLARAAHEITAWDVIDVLGGNFFPDTFCDAHPGQRHDCVRSTDCSVRALWRKLASTVKVLLRSVTLADMQRSEPDVLLLLGQPPEQRSGLPRDP